MTRCIHNQCPHKKCRWHFAKRPGAVVKNHYSKRCAKGKEITGV